LCEGWIAYDDAQPGKRPGVLVVPTNGRASANTERRRLTNSPSLATTFSSQTSTARASGPNPTAGLEAGKYKKDRALLRARVNAALSALGQDARTDASKIAATGYCFGGTTVLELARSGANVKGVVSFHGGLDSPAPADGKNIKGRVLALHGADDPFVPGKDVDAFEQEMKSAGVDYKLIKYPGAVHSFTHKAAGNDNSKGAAYNAEADRDSWIQMKAFLTNVFTR
jgi:dienelactone hydrolase